VGTVGAGFLEMFDFFPFLTEFPAEVTVIAWFANIKLSSNPEPSMQLFAYFTGEKVTFCLFRIV
jgi:hypothetical protein